MKMQHRMDQEKEATEANGGIRICYDYLGKP